MDVYETPLGAWTDGGPTDEALASLPDYIRWHSWDDRFRAACPDSTVPVESWQYVNVGDATFCGALAGLGVSPEDAQTWVTAVSHGRGTLGLTQQRRVLSRIAKWLEASFSASEALAFCRAGIKVGEATRIAERDADGDLSADLRASLDMLAVFRT